MFQFHLPITNDILKDRRNQMGVGLRENTLRMLKTKKFIDK